MAEIIDKTIVADRSSDAYVDRPSLADDAFRGIKKGAIDLGYVAQKDRSTDVATVLVWLRIVCVAQFRLEPPEILR